jgi:hypothetical protein
MIQLHEECLQTNADWKKCIQYKKRDNWLNIGGQLMPEEDIHLLKTEIKEDSINDWQEVHRFYILQGKKYSGQKRGHALSSLADIKGVNLADIAVEDLMQWFDEAVEIKKMMVDAIHSSREKDYTNPFRKMTYENEKEMNEVLGKLNDNSFIRQQQKEFDEFAQRIAVLKAKLEDNVLI